MGPSGICSTTTNAPGRLARGRPASHASRSAYSSLSRDHGPAGAVNPEGWLDTGDLGRLDSDGYLFLAGRSDDVINRGGEKLYPGEIEDFLLAQEGVSSAAVVAARDEVLGERPVAYVVPAGSWAPDKLEYALREACEAALPRARRPSAFVVVEEMPLGPTGKISRRRLRELVNRE